MSSASPSPHGGSPHRDFHVEMIGHATLAIRYGGRTLLTDPWLVDPMGCNGEYHFPPLVHDPAEVVARTDAIYISHVHPDHFHRKTLEMFPRHVPVFIGEYGRKRFRDDLAALGFEVVEVPFQQPTRVPGTELTIAILEHDYDENAAFDSSIVVQTPAFCLFENNDCFLRPGKYQWVAEQYQIDYAFLGYSAASFFPICFEMEPDLKERLLIEAAERRYGDFLEAATLLKPRLTIPFANGARFFLEESLWKNVSFNSGLEATARLQPHGLAGTVMGPGDRILTDGAIERVCPVLGKVAELAAIRTYALSVQDMVLSRRTPPTPPADDLVERFRDYLLQLWRESRDAIPGVRGHVIAYVVLGVEEKRFHFDFSRDDGEIFGWGTPARYDMRYTYPAEGLQMTLDGRIDWDELHFTDKVSVHQITYARDFYRMLRSESLDVG